MREITTQVVHFRLPDLATMVDRANKAAALLNVIRAEMRDFQPENPIVDRWHNQLQDAVLTLAIWGCHQCPEPES